MMQGGFSLKVSEAQVGSILHHCMHDVDVSLPDDNAQTWKKNIMTVCMWKNSSMMLFLLTCRQNERLFVLHHTCSLDQLHCSRITLQWHDFHGWQHSEEQWNQPSLNRVDRFSWGCGLKSDLSSGVFQWSYLYRIFPLLHQRKCTRSTDTYKLWQSSIMQNVSLKKMIGSLWL